MRRRRRLTVSVEDGSRAASDEEGNAFEDARQDEEAALADLEKQYHLATAQPQQISPATAHALAQARRQKAAAASNAGHFQPTPATRHLFKSAIASLSQPFIEAFVEPQQQEEAQQEQEDEMDQGDLHQWQDASAMSQDAGFPYLLARHRLHVAALPPSLPCRDVEFEQIYNVLYNAINDNAGTCLYISGVPGTGKTATTKEVLRAIYTSVEEDGSGLRPFDALEINGMRITEPSQAYVELWRKISGGQQVTSRHAMELLETHFSSPKGDRAPLVVLMDELDLLVTKKQTVMYNFFEWPNRPASNLIVVAIANTMDLPERMLSNKVSSRLGLQRLNFQPYTLQQLNTIVSSRLDGLDVFEPAAIEFVARKVVTVTGDARRALDICRRSVELAERVWRQLGDKTAPLTRVKIAHVQEVIGMMTVSPGAKAIAAGSPIEKLFLSAVVKMIERKGVGEAILGDIIDECTVLARKLRRTLPTVHHLVHLCEMLSATRCLQVEGGHGCMLRRVRLGLNEDEVISALRADPITAPIFVQS